MKRFLLPAMLGGLLLSGCTPQMDEHIITEHDPALLGLKGKSVAVSTYPFKPSDPPEIPLYVKALQTKLVQQGYVITDNQQTADLVAMANYHIEPRTVKESYTVPEYTQTSPGGPTHVTGTVDTPNGRMPFDGTADLSPTYDVTGYSTHQLIKTVYDLTLSLVVFDNRHPTKGPVLYKGMVVSTGDCPSMPAVYPYLADALFKDWPGPSGGLHEMKLPMPGFRCRG